MYRLRADKDPLVKESGPLKLLIFLTRDGSYTYISIGTRFAPRNNPRQTIHTITISPTKGKMNAMSVTALYLPCRVRFRDLSDNLVHWIGVEVPHLFQPG